MSLTICNDEGSSGYESLLQRSQLAISRVADIDADIQHVKNQIDRLKQIPRRITGTAAGGDSSSNKKATKPLKHHGKNDVLVSKPRTVSNTKYPVRPIAAKNGHFDSKPSRVFASNGSIKRTADFGKGFESLNDSVTIIYEKKLRWTGLLYKLKSLVFFLLLFIIIQQASNIFRTIQHRAHLFENPSNIIVSN